MWQTSLRQGQGYADPGFQMIGGMRPDFVHLALARGRIVAFSGDHLYGLSQNTGGVLWKTATENTGGRTIYAVDAGAETPTAHASQVFITGHILYVVVEQEDRHASRIFAYDLNTGLRIWRLPLQGDIVEIIAHKGALYVLRTDWLAPFPAQASSQFCQFWLMKLTPLRQPS